MGMRPVAPGNIGTRGRVEPLGAVKVLNIVGVDLVSQKVLEQLFQIERQLELGQPVFIDILFATLENCRDV